MGGAVSSGCDNNDLVDNLVASKYIRSKHVEQVFRALDRADYMNDARDQAYKDVAWRHGPLHISAPCIYSEVLEGLELKPGLSFLNVGSGTGYLSTMVGLILGPAGTNHGIEFQPVVVDYANKKLNQFLETSDILDEFDFCEPKFFCGNGLSLAPLQAHYDRVYCGAGCPEEYLSYFQQLIKVGGVVMMPLNDQLLQVRRLGEAQWASRCVFNVSFATLIAPRGGEEPVHLDGQSPPRLSVLCRAVVRARVRGGLVSRRADLRPAPPAPPPAKRPCPRRVCLPLNDFSDEEELQRLHDLDPESGAHEMNALLSLVLSMGHNRVAGSLRLDHLDSSPPASDTEPATPPRRTPRDRDRRSQSRSSSDSSTEDEDERGPGRRNVIRFEFRNRSYGDEDGDVNIDEHGNGDGPDGGNEAGDVDGPAVEIFLEHCNAAAATAPAPLGPSERSEPSESLEPSEPLESRPTDGKRELSGDESRRSRTEDKRQKLDSGLGDDASPASGSGSGSGSASGSRSEGHGSEDEPREEDERSRSSSRSESSSEEETESVSTRRRRRRRLKRRSGAGGRGGRGRGRGGGGDAAASARRARLSRLMRAAVRALPLPPPLLLYVNLGRPFRAEDVDDVNLTE